MIIHRRSQLLKWLEHNAPTASIRRAVGEGSVEYLGFFFAVQGSIFPGWITKVTSTITGIIWHVVIRPTFPDGYRAWMLDGEVPWWSWNTTNSTNPFTQGDDPETYRQNRENIKTQRRTEVHQEDIPS